MSSHQTIAKPRSSKYCHFSFLFNTHNYCPTCRESGKGDDHCVTNLSPCNICASFSEEQQIKIKHRRRYVRKQTASDPCNASKEDDLDLLGDDVETFSGSQADLEGAAENLVSSPPHPQPLRFESLSLKTPQTVPSTPSTALQNKIESRLEKSLGYQFNIQLQQQMGVFQASMLEAMKSLRDEMHSMNKASESDVVQTSDSVSKAGPSQQPDPITTRTSISTLRCPTNGHGPLWTSTSSKVHSKCPVRHASRHSDLESNHMDNHSESEQPKRVCSKAKNILTKGSIRYRQSIILSRLLQRKMSPLS